MSDVFISHSSKDKAIADKVVAYLEERGVSCWIAPRNIVPGSDWAASISTAITSSKCFLLIYSRNSAESDQVPRELTLAEDEKSVFVIPYKIDDTPLKDSFKYYLSNSHWISADYSKNSFNLEALYNFIIGITGKTVQNITNNTYIDHLHVHSAEEVGSVIRNIQGSSAPQQAPQQPPQQPVQQAPRQQENIPQPPAAPAPVQPAVPQQSAKSKGKLPLIIGLVSGAACLLIVAVICIGVANTSKKNTTETAERTGASYTASEISRTSQTKAADGGASETSKAVSEKPESQASAAASTEESSGKPDLSKYTLNLNGHEFTGKYSGSVNSEGLPDGDGDFTGTYKGYYFKDENDVVTLKYYGSFSNGMLYCMEPRTSSKTCSLELEITNTKDAASSYTETYKGTIASGYYSDGDRTLNLSDGTSINYIGTFKNGERHGYGEETFTAADGSKVLYEGEYRCEGESDSKMVTIKGKRTKYSSDGKVTQEDTGTYTNYKLNGNDIKRIYYANNNPQKIEKGAFKDDKLVRGVVQTTDADGVVISETSVG